MPMCLRGKDSEPFQVRRNEYANLPPKWDVNSTENILEVINDKGIPMLQIVNKSENEIQINGVFIHSGGVLIASRKSTQYFPVRGFEIVKVPLEAIFKYPSFQHPGEFAKP